MKKNHKFITFFFILIITILIIIFLNNDYKKSETGNNKTIQEIENYILNIKNYEAVLDVTIVNNRNENNYKIKQEITSEYEKQTILEPEEAKGLEIIYEKGKLEIKNTNLNLSKIYENYPNICENNLFLTQFIQSYANEKENKTLNVSDENKVVMQVKTNRNKYDVTQVLYVNMQNLKPEKLEILDNNNNKKVYILYNEIEINI